MCSRPDNPRRQGLTKWSIFFADHRSISGCEPGWYKAGKSCFLFSFQSCRQWRYARTFCHQLDADLAVVNDQATLQALVQHRREIKLEDRDLFLGLSGSRLRWTWLDGEEISTSDKLWGPNEPTGEGRCGAFLNAIEWNSNWAGYGWRWNDLSCTAKYGYICEQPLGMSCKTFSRKPSYFDLYCSSTFMHAFFHCIVRL